MQAQYELCGSIFYPQPKRAGSKSGGRGLPGRRGLGGAIVSSLQWLAGWKEGFKPTLLNPLLWEDAESETDLGHPFIRHKSSKLVSGHQLLFAVRWRLKEVSL